MKLDRIYTRSGDDGRTSLGDGARLPKFHVRVAAYGSIDDPNSVIGIALLYVGDSVVRDVLTHIQNDLFDVGADLCRPQREHRKVEPLRVSEGQVTWIEREDRFVQRRLGTTRQLRSSGRHARVGLSASRPHRGKAG
jgi:cob(I)alamin adenosyltransferase